jgi:hypothetical protein
MLDIDTPETFLLSLERPSYPYSLVFTVPLPRRVPTRCTSCSGWQASALVSNVKLSEQLLIESMNVFRASITINHPLVGS